MTFQKLKSQILDVINYTEQAGSKDKPFSSFNAAGFMVYKGVNYKQNNSAFESGKWSSGGINSNTDYALQPSTNYGDIVMCIFQFATEGYDWNSSKIEIYMKLSTS
jgi:hypothetical protein